MGSKTQVVQPTAPPAPSTGDAIKEYVAAQPQLFALQQQQAPQEAALQLQLLQQYGQPLGQALRDAQRAINPELTALQDQLSAQALSGSQSGIPEDLRNQYLNDFKALVGNQVNSGIGASSIAGNLLDRDLAYRQFNQNLGLSLAGYQPIAQPFAPTITQQTAGLTPNSILGANSSNYGSRLGFERPFTTQTGGGFASGLGIASSLLGGIGGLGLGLGSAGLGLFKNG